MNFHLLSKAKIKRNKYQQHNISPFLKLLQQISIYTNSNMTIMVSPTHIFHPRFCPHVSLPPHTGPCDCFSGQSKPRGLIGKLKAQNYWITSPLLWITVGKAGIFKYEIIWFCMNWNTYLINRSFKFCFAWLWNLQISLKSWGTTLSERQTYFSRGTLKRCRTAMQTGVDKLLTSSWSPLWTPAVLLTHVFVYVML